MFNFPTEKPNVPPRTRIDVGLIEPEGWCHGTVRMMFRDLIGKHRPKIMAEIGSYMGCSAHFIMKHTYETTLYCIDHWQGSPEHQGIESTKTLYETFLVNVWDYKDRIKPVRMDSIKGLHALHKNNICPEIIFIDGSHDEESVTKDICTASMLFPDAVLCGDDYTWDGVKSAVDNTAKDNNWKVVTIEDIAWRYEK